MNAARQYIELYESHVEAICRHGSPVMNALREQAFSDFKRMGFPTPKHEKYKYTDVETLFSPDYGLNINRLSIPVNPYEVFKCDVPNMSTALHFVINDTYLPARPVPLPDGVIAGSLRDNAEKVREYYGCIAHTSSDAIVALNTMLAQDGFLLYVPKGVVVDCPLQLVNILRADVDFMVNRRMLVVLEEGAQARLLVCDHAMNDVHFMATQVAEVFAGRDSVFEFCEFEENHEQTVRFSNLFVRQEGNSQVRLNGVTLHNGVTRNTIEVALVGRGASLDVGGIAIADGREHIDNNIFVNHQVPDCVSHELFKYVLDNEAVGAFAGKVCVSHGAQHTEARQTNKNLCATKGARMFTQPQLEIYADDVKCSHGASVGQLDEAALFYMQQRGISRDEARMLLMFAFVNEVIDLIPMDALRDRLHLLIEKRFRGELNACTDSARHYQGALSPDNGETERGLQELKSRQAKRKGQAGLDYAKARKELQELKCQGCNICRQ